MVLHKVGLVDNLQAIEERNEILLQTGFIDTTSEHPPVRSAIILVGKNEIALTLISADTSDRVIVERYQGSDYSITLSYQSKIDKYDKIVYFGTFILENNRSTRKFEVEGKKCTL